MPCVSVRNNRARKASIKAANIERKNNRKNTQIAKKQQSAALRVAKKQQAIDSHIAKKQQKENARTTRKQQLETAKAARKQQITDAKAQKTRQSLEKRVVKKHQIHRAKTKSAKVKAEKVQTKLAAKIAAKATRTSAKAAAKAAKSQAKAVRTQARAAKISATKSAIKTSAKSALSKTFKLPKASIQKAKAALKSQFAQRTTQKTAKSAQKQSQTSSDETSQSIQDARVAKISGADVQNSFKIPHDLHAANHKGYNYDNVAQLSTDQTATPQSNMSQANIAPSVELYNANPAIYAPKPLRRTAFMTKDDLINAESRLGSTIFGPVPAGHRREFFHDRENIWIWFESWRDETDHQHQLTVRYEVRTSGVYKKISAGSYFKLAGDELENFRRATHAYLYIVKKYLYPNAATR